MKTLTAIEGGLAGAMTLTALHELIKRYSSDAPRMDLLGMSALSKLLYKTFHKEANPQSLFVGTLASDLVANAIYYSLSNSSNRKNTFLKGLALGLVAGAGALFLPKPLGLNQVYSGKTTKTKWFTVALYLTGGLIASTTINLLRKKDK